jgi:hypothetical protein
MMKRIGLWIALVIAATVLLALPAYAQFTQTEVQKLLADDKASDDVFGHSVAIDGDTAVISSPVENDSGTIWNGAAYVFTRTGGIWTQQTKLLANDKASMDRFGSSVAIDGDTMVIGAGWKSDSGISENGAAYVFTRAGSIWTQQAKLLASDKDNYEKFGGSVAIDGDTIVIGASEENDSGTRKNGAVYVFTRSGSTWTQQAKLLASDKATSDYFGTSVSIDGDTAVIGAYRSSNSGADKNGAAYVFTRSDGTWVQQAKLLASDMASGDNFGRPVSIDGDTAVIGAYRSSSSGAVYVFIRSAGTWVQQAKLLASDRAYGDNFGSSVALDGDTAVIGAINQDDTGTENNGAAYVFIRSAGAWTQHTKLVASDKASWDWFGNSIDIDGDTAVIGANYEDDSGTENNGAAYVFDLVDDDRRFVRALGDINGDGNEDIVALNRKDGKLLATVKDAETPRWIRTIRFNSSLVPVDLEVMPDTNGNGSPELVVLGTSSAKSEIRDSLTGEKLGAVGFNPNLSPIDLELVTDLTGNGVPELAMLGEGSMRVEIKDPVSNAWVKSMFFNNYVPKDLSVWNRGNRVYVGVLAHSKDPTQSDKVEIRDLASGQIVKHLWVSRPFDLLQMELVSDLNGNGAPELAILREHPFDNWVSVQAMDTASGYRFPWLGFDPQYRPVRFRVLDDLNGNGSQEVAVLAVRRGSGNQKVWVKDTLTGESIRQVFFGKQFIGEDMDIVPDINGNGTPELVVLGRRDDGKIAAIIKDSKTAEFISWVAF